MRQVVVDGVWPAARVVTLDDLLGVRTGMGLQCPYGAVEPRRVTTVCDRSRRPGEVEQLNTLMQSRAMMVVSLLNAASVRRGVSGEIDRDARDRRQAAADREASI